MIDYNFGDLEYVHSRCEELADEKPYNLLPIILAEELTELTQLLMKSKRYDLGDKTLRDDIFQIHENLYEEISDVIVTLFQLIYAFNFSYEKIIRICNEKIDRTFETLNK